MLTDRSEPCVWRGVGASWVDALDRRSAEEDPQERVRDALGAEVELGLPDAVEADRPEDRAVGTLASGDPAERGEPCGPAGDAGLGVADQADSEGAERRGGRSSPVVVGVTEAAAAHGQAAGSGAASADCGSAAAAVNPAVAGITQRHFDRWYSRHRGESVSMGRRGSYAAAMSWLDLPHCVIEDWGGGTGFAGRYVRLADYRVVDWAGEPDTEADLRHYLSSADCILLRHVLEHNDEWRRVLTNAVESYRRRLAVVLFLPLADRTHDEGGHRFPWIRFKLADLLAVAGEPAWSTQVGRETILAWER